MNNTLHYCTYMKTNIAYTDNGTGRCIVLLHGFMETNTIWNNYVLTLSKLYRVICINLPGHGTSDCLGYAHTMELMADSVNAVLQHLRLSRVFIIGHSMGGYVALALAEKHPAKIKGICLFHSTASADSEERKLNRDKALSLIKNNHKKFITSVIPLWFAKENRVAFADEIEALKTEALAMPKQALVAALEGMKARIDREMVLKFSSFRVFYIIGKKDETIPYEQVKTQTTLPNDCEYLILDNVGHMGFIEAPQICLKALKSFARKAFK
jgi:pimeloyl-ACP methyl ester carboxylesterase